MNWYVPLIALQVNNMLLPQRSVTVDLAPKEAPIAARRAFPPQFNGVGVLHIRVSRKAGAKAKALLPAAACCYCAETLILQLVCNRWYTNLPDNPSAGLAHGALLHTRKQFYLQAESV